MNNRFRDRIGNIYIDGLFGVTIRHDGDCVRRQHDAGISAGAALAPAFDDYVC
ncbi:MAG TPA: hypothetical protein VFJ02_17180 [Vicinamibacterales bacterium]|nr:hypothetical protein [Vicinamibacterales bacterium]